MKGIGKKPLRIIPLEKRLMLDASLAGLVTSIVIPEADANSTDTVIDNDGDVTISGTTTDFSSESLVISTTGGVEDQLAINNEGTGTGQIGVSGTDVTYEGVIIGTISSNGVNGANLTIDFNANSSQAAIERLIENVTYRNVSDTPTANRTVNFSLGILFSEDVSIGVAPGNDPLLAGNNTGFTVTEGATITITNTQLSTTDVDNTPSEIIYTVTNAPLRGDIQLSGSNTTTFTQDDIDNNRVTYVHDGTESTFDGFDFTVTDGDAILTEDRFDIAVTIVNDAPTVSTNNSVTVSLGFSTTLGGTAGDFGTQTGSYAPNSTFGTFQTQIDALNSQLRFTFTTPSTIPTDVPGQVLFESGGAGVGMTLALNSNNELALYAGSATSAPRLVSPISLETSTQYSVVVEVSDTDNQLRIFYEQAANHDWFFQGRNAEAVLTGFTQTDFVGTDNGGYGLPNSTGSFGGFNGTSSGTGVFQGTLDSNLIITRAPTSPPTANIDLVTTDPNTPPGQIVYTITNTVDDGVLRLNGVALGLSDTFTQADLNKGLITYDSVTDPTGPDTDSFGFSVTDGNTVINDTYVININTVNTAPEIYDETVIYSEDFTGGTTGWNNNRTTTDPVLGEFWGRFNRDIDGPNDQDLNQTFTLSGAQEYVTVSFDLLEIDSWDNEELFLFVDDTRYTIANNLNHNRFDTPNDISNSNLTASITELSNDNGYILGREDIRDQVYRFEIEIPNTASSIKLGFGTNLNGTSFNDESFGIDNLEISELRAGGTGVRTVEISELVTNGERVARIQAGDADVGQALSYSITGGTGSSVFAINANGDITVTDATQIDFETMPTTYTLNVQVRDNGPGLLTDTQTLTINIRDALENTRPDINNQTFSIAEDITNGSSVGTVAFTDPEGDGIELWQITDGNELGVFTINATTGEITIADNSTIDFENDNRYDIRIRAWDDADLGLFHDRTLRIDVTNVDNAPTLDAGEVGVNFGANVFYSSATGNFYRFVDSSVNYTTALAAAQSATLNGINGQLLNIESNAEKAFINSISDQNLWLGISDAAVEGEWRYTSGPNTGLQFWQGGTPGSGGVATNGFFTDWRGGGEPGGNDTAVFVRNDGRWVDATGNQRYVIEWTGQDVVNNDTYFFNYDTPADITNGASVGTVQGLDPEGDTLTYSVTGGTGNTLFAVNPTTGEITITNAAGINPATNYTLNVRATEDNGLNQTADATITIILNENLSIDTNNGHAATEGTTTIINPTTELTVSDNDGVATDIIFDIDTFPVNGQLQLTTNAGVGITTFTLDDLNNSRVQYVHDGTETTTDNFTFTVTDGGQTLPLETFNIAITPVNDAPTINVNTGATVIEGATVTVTSAMLNSLDVDNTDVQLTYTASNYTRGQIEVSGSAQNTFTQDDINNNLVVFRHDGNEGNASFDISLSDGALTDTATFNLTTTPQNDPVTITTNTGFSVLEGGTFNVTTTQLNVTDPDDSGTGITYNISNLIGGQIQLSNNLGVPVVSFTQADLTANRVRFIHDGGETNASFDISVEDGLEQGAVADTGTVNVTRIPVNDAPTAFRNLGTSVNEGGVTLINELILLADDPDNAPADLTYTITNESNGQLELLSNLGTQITSFTQAQLNAGDIVFRHDGTSTTTASFDFNISDGALSSGVETFNMTVDNVNDPPVISVGPSTTVIEGQSVAITTAQLNSIDPDNLPAFLTYTVTSTTAGDVQLSGVNTTTFTQAQLSAGLISFVHDGSEGALASFGVSLSDGSLTDTASVSLNVTPQNDQAILVVNDGDPNVIDFRDFTIDPHETGQDNGVGTVSTDGTTLTLTGNPWKKIDIAYTLTANTVLSFEFRTDALLDIQGIGFDTDTSVGNGLFGYQIHGFQIWNGVDQSFRNYQLGDGWVRYDIPIGADYTGVIANLTFVGDNDANAPGSTEFRNVNFYESGAILDLNEGNTFNITTAHINSVDPDDSGTGLTYTITNQRNGQLQVSGVNVGSFTQADLDGGLVTFVHDGSETLNAGFDISLADGLEHGAVAQTDTFNLIINPVNDNAVLNTNTTLTLDENATAVIANTNLNITDADDSPNDVVITVTSNPADGIITRASAPTTSITSFTLAELNAGVIRYTQQGAENASDSFEFSVSDPTGSATTGTFNFTINPINDNTVLTQNNAVNIAESGTVAITLADLNTSDPDNTRAQRIFTITDSDSGWVELTTQSGFPVTSFTQNDIANGLVVFRHDGSAATTSSFDFSVSDPTGTATTGTFNLNVTPPVNEAPVVAISDGTPTTIDFSTTTISPYDASGFGNGQGSTFTDFDVSNDGTVLTIYGNAWKKIPLPITITADTVLTFDFRSTREGELQGIGFDNDDNIGNGIFSYKLFGTDSSVQLDNTYDTYNLGDGWTRFEIPVGDTFTGAVTDLFFVADDDAGADTLSQFRNVSVYEANPTFTFNEGASIALTNTNFNVFDTDTPATSLTYTVTGTLNGNVQLNGTNTTTFTQDDINNNRVTFLHDGSETTAADFDFTVTDGNATTASETINFTINPVNDDTVINTNNTITLAENATVTISSTDLNITDVDNVASDVIINITSTPSDGFIALSSAPTTPITSFTLAQLNAGNIRYVHNGAENATDNFNFTVTDGTFTSTSQPFNFIITPVNDAPIINTNNTITLAENATATISSTDLNITDIDNVTGDVVINITSAPTDGFIALSSVPTTPITSFTLTQLNAGNIRYVHNGAENATDNFNFTVTDGTFTSTSQQFNFNITPVNDAPVVINNGATLNEGGSFTFAGSLDGVVTSLNVGGTPTNLYVDNVGSESWILIGRGREGWEFDTDGQGNVANILTGLGTTAAFTPIAYDDAFVNSLMTSLGQDLSDTDIRIKRAANITGTEYQEVRWTNASRANWSWDLDGNRFTVDQTSADSVLGTGVTDIGVDTQDTNPQTNNNHERIWTFNWPGKGNIPGFSYGSAISGVNGNDPNTFLWENTSENHATPYAEIYIKSNAFINSVISLETNDADNTNADITYQITTATSNGTMTRGGVALGVNDTFTQADLDNGLISYQHDGSETTSDAFNFTTTDGTATLSTDTFNITIDPVNDAPNAVNLDNMIVSERETNGFTIGTLSTADVDLPGDTFTYSITADPDGKFTLVGNELILNNTLSFVAAETHSVTIQTDDNNGGLFSQTFTINVERVDNGVNILPGVQNFGDAGRGLLEEDRDLSGDARPSLIHGLIANNGLDAAFYGADNLPQILRQNTQFIVPNIQQNDGFNFSVNNDGITSADNENAPSTGNETDDSDRYTRLVDFLKSTANFSGEDAFEETDDSADNTSDDTETIISIRNINDQFDDVLTYHQHRAQQLLDVLKDNSAS